MHADACNIDGFARILQVMKEGVAYQFSNLSAKMKTEFSYNAAHSWVVDSETCAHPGVQQPLKACCG